MIRISPSVNTIIAATNQPHSAEKANPTSPAAIRRTTATSRRNSENRSVQRVNGACSRRTVMPLTLIMTPNRATPSAIWACRYWERVTDISPCTVTSRTPPRKPPTVPASGTAPITFLSFNCQSPLCKNSSRLFPAKAVRHRCRAVGARLPFTQTAGPTPFCASPACG